MITLEELLKKNKKRRRKADIRKGGNIPLTYRYFDLEGKGEIGIPLISNPCVFMLWHYKD